MSDDSTSYWLDVRSWRDGRELERVCVDRGFFDERVVGDRVAITAHDGALGMDWWSRIALAEP